MCPIARKKKRILCKTRHVLVHFDKKNILFLRYFTVNFKVTL